MAEDHHPDPFERHINSEKFDVSKLDDAGQFSELDSEFADFLASLQQPLSHELWDTELDQRQKAISAYLATELVDRVLRVHHADEVQDLDDDQLIYLLTVPITLAMIAEERLHRKPVTQPEPQPKSIPVAVFNHPTSYPSQSSPNTIQLDFSGVRVAFIRLFNRARDFLANLMQKR